jgi:hypothetical protein
MRHSLPSVLVALLLSIASLARAHHGVAAISVAGPEGPSAALETTSALPLPKSFGFAMLKSEYVSFAHMKFAEPENKDYSVFNILALGFGIVPWLSAYAFQPLNVKAQDNVGTNVGLSDTNLMLSFYFKYDEGLTLVPEKESLDELMDWHFSLWASSTLPVGSTEHLDDTKNHFAPDMQTGFGTVSPAVGFAVLKQLSGDFTWLAEINYQHFFPHTYSDTRYQFGGETRLNTAITYKIWGTGRFRIDAVGELCGLHLQRDRERDEKGHMADLRASGGAILYAALGVRTMLSPFSLALGIRRAVLKSLNEEKDQQGSEGLENFRASFALSYAMGF